MGDSLLLIGGGGHCRSVLDSLFSLGCYARIGIIDSRNDLALDVPVVGCDNDIPSLIEDGWTSAFITVGSVGNTKIRRRLYDLVKKYQMTIPVIIDPSSIVAKGTVIKEGTYVGKHSVINAGAIVEECSIINTGAIIEHDCKVESFSHISPGSILCGGVIVGADTHIGAGAVIRQGINIGEKSIIGAGSVVVKDIPGHVCAYGNPCKVIE